ECPLGAGHPSPARQLRPPVGTWSHAPLRPASTAPSERCPVPPRLRRRHAAPARPPSGRPCSTPGTPRDEQDRATQARREGSCRAPLRPPPRPPARLFRHTEQRGCGASLRLELGPRADRAGGLQPRPRAGRVLRAPAAAGSIISSYGTAGVWCIPPARIRTSCRPSRRASATPQGWKSSPRTRSRYTVEGSSTRTALPARASTVASALPAMPPPMTTTSNDSREEDIVASSNGYRKKILIHWV